MSWKTCLVPTGCLSARDDPVGRAASCWSSCRRPKVRQIKKRRGRNRKGSKEDERGLKRDEGGHDGVKRGKRGKEGGRGFGCAFPLSRNNAFHTRRTQEADRREEGNNDRLAARDKAARSWKKEKEGPSLPQRGKKDEKTCIAVSYFCRQYSSRSGASCAIFAYLV